MNYFSHYPYQNFSDYNLDWLMKLVKEVNEKLSEYLENSVITFADPITWDITEQYTALTCVVDSDGTAYLSKQPVPAGVDISNTNYWLPIFNYDDNINTLRSQIAYNARNSATTPAPLAAGDLVFWHGLIYQATADIPAGSALIVDSNIKKFTVDEKINSVQGDITNIRNDITNIQNDITNIQEDITAEEAARIAADNTLQENITAEENARIAADNTLQENITAEENARIAAVNELINQINNIDLDFLTPEEFGAVGDGVADDSAALQQCFNEASNNNKYVRLRNTYAVAEQILLPNNLIVKGYGNATIKDIAMFPASTDISKFGLLYANTKTDITFSNIHFLGKGAGTHYDRKYAILLQSSERVLFSNCNFTDQSGISCVYARSSTRVYIYNCTVTDYTYGAFQFVEGTKQAGVFFSRIQNGHETESTNRYPIMLCGYDEDYSGRTAPQGYDLFAIGNVITDTAPWWEGIDAHGGQRIFISNNTVSSVATPIAVFSNRDRGFEARHVFVHDNFFNTTKNLTTNPGARYGNAFGGLYFHIYHNYFSHGGHAYRDENSAQLYFDKGQSLIFENNIVEDSYGTVMKFAGDYSAVLIKNNLFSGLTPTTNIAFDMVLANIISFFIYENNEFANYVSCFRAPATKTNANQYIRLKNNEYGIAETPSFINGQYIAPDYATAAQIAISTCCKNGDICINSAAASGQPMGWIGTGASHGTGTWKPLANIGA